MLVDPLNAKQCEDNLRLIVDLMREWNAASLGHINNFAMVDPDWLCPSCFRDKARIARLDKNGNLYCAIVEHHDHFEDVAHEHMEWLRQQAEWRKVEVLRESLRRFPPTLICNDCNVSEPAAKKIADAPKDFSFAPFEISQFIIVTDHAKHELDSDRVVETYEAARPTMRLLYKRMKQMADPKKLEGTDWQPLGGLAWSITVEANKERKSGKGVA